MTLIVTNLIKLAGLVLAVDEVLVQPQPRALVLGVAAFMMAGAQFSEEAVLLALGRFFGASASDRLEK